MNMLSSWFRLAIWVSLCLLMLIAGLLQAARAADDHSCVRLSMPEQASMTMNVRDGLQIQLTDKRSSLPPGRPGEPEAETLYRRYSPDRKYLAYFSPQPGLGGEGGAVPIESTLFVKNMQTGNSVPLRKDKIW